MNAPGDLDTRITTDLPPMVEGPIPVEPHGSAEFFERDRAAGRRYRAASITRASKVWF